MALDVWVSKLTSHRYNAFLPLYPVGLLSEAWLVYLVLTEGTGVGSFYKGYLLIGLLTYLPGKSSTRIRVAGHLLYGALANAVEAGPFLYTHMLSQRRKVMKQHSGKKSD